MAYPRALHEPPALAGFRFVLEVAAWVLIYFAWGWVPGILAVAALTLFSVPGDKHLILVAVPGWLRILLEACVAAAGVAAAARVLGPPAAFAVLGAVLLLAVLAHRRWSWLWRAHRTA